MNVSYRLILFKMLLHQLHTIKYSPIPVGAPIFEKAITFFQTVSAGALMSMDVLTIRR